MDNKIDWSLAPEGATHKDTSCPSGFWYKFDFDSNQACYWTGKGWTNPISSDAYNDGSMDVMEPRPARPWRGPEDGLPHVGTVVIAQRPDNKKWIESEVLKHGDSTQAQDVCAFMEVESHRLFWSNDYKQKKSPEQIAHELRESKIIEMMNIAGVDCKVIAGRLVDAGYVRGDK